MKGIKFVCAILALTFTSLLWAQTPPGIRVKPSSIPAPFAGSASRLISNAACPGADCPTASSEGQMRTTCKASHVAPDDPILWPAGSGPGKSHWHTFFGNTDTSHTTDITVDPQTTGGNGTCRGGIINRSRYWVPIIIDIRTGAMVPLTVASIQVHVYYKSGASAGPASETNRIPTNFRVIAGNAAATTYQGSNIVKLVCYDGVGGIGNQTTLADFVSASKSAGCVAGKNMWMVISFPQCLSTTLGVPDIDSPDHKAHAAYGTGSACPGTHPYQIPQITYNVIYDTPTPKTDLKYWRFACDVHNGPGGPCFHGDFDMGWQTNPASPGGDIHGRWIHGCIKAQLDCHSHLLGCKDADGNTMTCQQLN